MKKKYRTFLQLHIELELSKIELQELNNSIALIEHRKRLYSNSNLPKRYYDYKRRVEYISKLVRSLDEELRSFPETQITCFSQDDKSFLDLKLSTLTDQFNSSKETLTELGWHFEGNRAPRGWHEANEVHLQNEKKLVFFNQKITEFFVNEKAFQTASNSQCLNNALEKRDFAPSSKTFTERNFRFIWMVASLSIIAIAEYIFCAKGMQSIYIGIPAGFLVTGVIFFLNLKK